jgi:prophage regulatory protein
VTSILSKRQTAQRTSLHPATIMRFVREGRFPKPIKLSKTRVGFVEDEVVVWLEAKISERDA